jgi:Domain of unknown function (DUF4336)
MLEEFGPSLYLADGPTVSFLGFPYPTRMVIVRLTDGSAWVWSPVALIPDLEGTVNAIGPLRYIVSPNKIHHLWLKEWAERWPDAHLYAPPGLAKKRGDLIFAAEPGDAQFGVRYGGGRLLPSHFTHGDFWGSGAAPRPGASERSEGNRNAPRRSGGRAWQHSS